MLLTTKWLLTLATLGLLVFNNRCSASFYMSIDGGGRGYAMPGYGYRYGYGRYGYPSGYEYGYPYGQSYSYGHGHSPYIIGRESPKSANAKEDQHKVVGSPNATGYTMRPFQETSDPGYKQTYSQPSQSYRYTSNLPVTPPKNAAPSANAQVPTYFQSQMMEGPQNEAETSTLRNSRPIVSNTYLASTDEIDWQNRMIGSINPSGYNTASYPNLGAARFYPRPQPYYRYVSYSPDLPSKFIGLSTSSVIPPYRYQIMDGQQKDSPILGLTGPIVSPYPNTNQAYTEEYEDQGGVLTSINPSGYVMTSYQTPPGIVQHYSQPLQSYRYTSYSMPPTGMSTDFAIPQRQYDMMDGQAKEERGQGNARPISPYPNTNEDTIVGAAHGYSGHHYGNHNFNAGFLVPRPHGGIAYANLHNHHANSGHLFGARHYYG